MAGPLIFTSAEAVTPKHPTGPSTARLLLRGIRREVLFVS
jgi:hypothetical protein